MRREHWWGALAAILILVAMWGGANLKERSMVAAQTERVDVDRKITDWIVKRNPGASIRDFAGFPEYLMAESSRAGVDFRFVMAVIDKESEFVPTAVSSAGAIGLMQLMPPTAALVVQKIGAEGYEAPVRAPKGSAKLYQSLGSLGDPRWSVRLGLTYLRWQMDDYGIGAHSLQAYNRGPNRARLVWQHDRYAQDVALRFVLLAHMIKP